MEGVPFFFSKFVQRMSLFVALRSYAENDAQRPLLEIKADTLLRRGDRRF
jgi:hypothetical protein